MQVNEKDIAGIAPVHPVTKKENTDAKHKVEEEVKEHLKDEDVPVEPVLGNDGIEVGGEG